VTNVIRLLVNKSCGILKADLSLCDEVNLIFGVTLFRWIKQTHYVMDNVNFLFVY
jgi:hypothetical protein